MRSQDDCGRDGQRHKYVILITAEKKKKKKKKLNNFLEYMF
jgi:hypothetical protein